MKPEHYMCIILGMDRQFAWVESLEFKKDMGNYSQNFTKIGCTKFGPYLIISNQV
jgi:hypothetical protein